MNRSVTIVKNETLFSKQDIMMFEKLNKQGVEINFECTFFNNQEKELIIKALKYLEKECSENRILQQTNTAYSKLKTALHIEMIEISKLINKLEGTNE